METTHHIKIERGVPIPRKRARDKRYGGVSNLFRIMKKGDSVFVPNKDGRDLNVHSKYMFRLAWRVSKEMPGVKFATRQEPGGVRIWRIS